MAEYKVKLDNSFLLKHAQTVYNNSNNYRMQDLNYSWRKETNLYDGKFETDLRNLSAVLNDTEKLFIPKTYTHLQRMIVDIMESLFFDIEEICNISSWKSTPNAVREILQSVINYRLNGHPINFYFEALEAAIDALKNKVGIFKVYPHIQSDKQGNIVFYQPILECIPYEDLFVSTEATWKDYWKYPMVHRMWKSKDWLKRRGYKNLELIQQSHIGDSTDEIKMLRKENAGSPFQVNMYTEEMLGQCEIQEIWTFLDVNNDGFLESCVFTTAGKGQPEVIISDLIENDLPFQTYGEDYNRPPFVVGQALPEPHVMYGKSIPMITEGLQRETNAIRNQRREAVALAIRRPIMVARGAGVDYVSLMNREMASIVLGDDISPMSVRELETSDPTNSSVQEMMKVDQDFYEATSIPPDLMGFASSPNQTATAATRHEANATKKIAQIIRNLAHTLWIPAFKLVMRMEQEYSTDEEIAKITGRTLGLQWSSDGVPPREVIQGDFDVRVDLGMDKRTKLNNLFMLMDRANIVNQTTMQLVAQRVVDPQNVKFIDLMYLYKKAMPLLNEKDTEAAMVQATPPPMEEGTVPGVASQPAIESTPQPPVLFGGAG